MKKLPLNNRSECPVSCFLDILGDKWSILIIRDLMFNKKTTFSEFLRSPEGIATNILTARLIVLEKNGIIEKSKDPQNKKVRVYSLTHKGRDLEPLMGEVYIWADKYFPVPQDIRVQIQRYKKTRKRAVRP